MYSVNYYAILVCGVSSMALGMMWYGPIFGKVWVKLMGFTQAHMEAAQKKGMGPSYILSFLSSCITAFVLSGYLSYNGLATINTAMIGVLFIWLGFYATTAISPVLWEGKSWKLYFIGIAHQLVQLAMFAAILVSWK